MVEFADDSKCTHTRKKVACICLNFDKSLPGENFRYTHLRLASRTHGFQWAGLNEERDQRRAALNYLTAVTNESAVDRLPKMNTAPAHCKILNQDARTLVHIRALPKMQNTSEIHCIHLRSAGMHTHARTSISRHKRAKTTQGKTKQDLGPKDASTQIPLDDRSVHKTV